MGGATPTKGASTVTTDSASGSSSRRRVIAQQWISADGFASGPVDEGQIFAAVSDFSDSERHNMELLAGVGLVLLGRRTYESFVEFWPEARDEPMAQLVNQLPKAVCSTTLTRAPWGDHAPAEVVPDAVADIGRRREEPGGDIMVWGSLALMRSLLTAGLVDELELFVAPVALGEGIGLIDAGSPIQLELYDGDVWPSGTARLRYRVTGAP